MKKSLLQCIGLIFAPGFLSSAFGQNPNAVMPLASPSLPDPGLSFVRVIGAFALVIGLFLGGVWWFRNWQRVTMRRGNAPKLNVLEMRSLGGRQAVYVVGYERERFLVSSSPTGVNLLTHLPAADEDEPAAKASVSFAQALAHVLKRK